MGFTVTTMDEINDLYYCMVSRCQLPDNFIMQIIVTREDFDNIVDNIACHQFGLGTQIDGDCLIQKGSMKVRLTVKK